MKEDDNDVLLITVEEACAKMKIGRNKMLDLVKLKGFPALIFPHKILIDKQQLPNWIAKNYGIFK